MIRFCEARIAVIFFSWPIAGAPSLIASLSSVGLPASAVPNSLISSCKRCVYGRRRVS